MKLLTAALSVLVPAAAASPLGVRSATAPSSTAVPYDFASGAVISYPIHHSCNVTLRRQLERALDEMVELATHAKEHILLQGQDSPFVKRYFGNYSTAQAIGWYERVASANKIDVLFRCDDPDRNCETQEGRFCIGPGPVLSASTSR